MLSRHNLPEHHLLYEINMLLGTAEILMYPNRTIAACLSDDVLKNSVLESYLVHLRNLKDFLWEVPRQDDITAGQFCSTKCDRQSSKSKDKLANLSINQIKTRINKQISHLTRARKLKTQNQMTWNIEKITCAMAGFLHTFIQMADRMDKTCEVSIEQNLSRFESRYCVQRPVTNGSLVANHSTTAVSTILSPVSTYVPTVFFIESL